MKVKKEEKKNKKMLAVPHVVSSEEQYIEFTCPVRGLVRQKVIVKTYSSCLPTNIPVNNEEDSDNYESRDAYFLTKQTSINEVYVNYTETKKRDEDFEK